jgi:hypothetical protein
MKPTEQGQIVIEDWLTPHGLKMIVDSSAKYKKAYGSYAFGVIRKIASKWIYLVVIAVVVVLVILYFTGALPGR